MTYAEIKDLVMHQINYDSEDVADFEPYIGVYVNEGYKEMVYAYAGVHVPTTAYPSLVEGADVPLTPVWTHKALADWATWCELRNGNPSKQQRGYLYKQAFDAEVAKLRALGGTAGVTAKITAFTNIPE